MVLHLLGKKGWNVYNQENVDRVRRDEAQAQAREEAEEQKLQEEDAERRIAILRGEKPLPLPEADEEVDIPRERRRRLGDGFPRKRKRLRGEDDTDRDIRYAREDAEAGAKVKEALLKRDDNGDGEPLHDHAGHIQLVAPPDEKAIRKAEKNAEAEAEKAKKRKREEDQYTMRFSNAAGYNNGVAKPWYAQKFTESRGSVMVLADVHDKDVWGNEDPLRKEREHKRISSNDPFAAMQQAQRQLKQSDRDKERSRKERVAEIEELRQAEERRPRHEKKRHRRDEKEDSLEGFSLDAPVDTKRERSDHDRHHRRRRRYRHRSKSRSRERSGTVRRRSSRD